ncbi:MAG: class I SAM-dependent methyltransferase [Pseudomonadota bacterium]
MQRQAEPELMDAPNQVQAYSTADFSEPNQRFVDHLLAQPFLDRRSRAPGHLIDLGCGPGDICLRLARVLPDWQILGVDAGVNMLNEAKREAKRQQLNDRVQFELRHLPDPSLPNGRYDIIASNSLLHHLPDPSILWQSLRQLGQVGTGIQVMDLHRPVNEMTARGLVEEHAGTAPDILKQDFFNSLKAAWTIDEVKQQIHHAGLPLTVSTVSDRHWMASGVLRD